MLVLYVHVYTLCYTNAMMYLFCRYNGEVGDVVVGRILEVIEQTLTVFLANSHLSGSAKAMESGNFLTFVVGSFALFSQLTRG